MMNVVSRTRLVEFWSRHAQASGPLSNWYDIVRQARWTCFSDVRQTFNSADQVHGLVVFNANSYRVIVDIFYPGRHVYIKHVFTHSEYDKWTQQQLRR